MALAVVGTVSRNTPFIQSVKFIAFSGKSLLRPQAKAVAVPSATIVSKIYQDESFETKPWPYKEKGYNLFHHYFCDKTQWRFNENTKMIVVEGPIASGKTTLAKKLADDLGMMYFPEATADMFYTNEYGFNIRELNAVLPKSAHFINKEYFYREPNMKTATVNLFKENQMSLIMYLDALTHVLNTGQGVVMDRIIYSNLVNIDSLINTGYVRKDFRRYYDDCFFYMSRNLLRPHLVIYLDVPVPIIQERIKKRAIDYELNTPVLSHKYLSEMEKGFKETFLPEISKHAELLVYDWSNFGDAEVVVEDIELIDFDKYTDLDEKLDDWRLNTERQWASARIVATNCRTYLHNKWNQDHATIPEMFLAYEDYEAQVDARAAHPTERYAVGYNSAAGDKNVLFKTGYYGSRFSGGAS